MIHYYHIVHIIFVFIIWPDSQQVVSERFWQVVCSNNRCYERPRSSIYDLETNVKQTRGLLHDGNLIIFGSY